VLFRMAKGGEMELLTQLSEGDLSALRPGNSATVTPVGSQAQFSGRVWQVSPVVDPQTRQGIARIAIPYNAAIRPGGFASATIVSGTATAPMLPESAVQTDDKGHYVYIINAREETERRDVEVQSILVVSWLGHLLQVDVRPEAARIDQIDVSRPVPCAVVVKDRLIELCHLCEGVHVDGHVDDQRVGKTVRINAIGGHRSASANGSSTSLALGNG